MTMTAENTSRRERTDIHRPSAIVPENYDFVGTIYLGNGAFYGDSRREVHAHITRTGGGYAEHQNDGSCHICGARATYLAVFHHPETNEYITVGEDCAAKMEMGHENEFRSLKRATADWRRARAGKIKAQGILSEAGLEAAWAIYEANNAHGQREEGTIIDIVGKLVRYGHSSDKSLEYVRTLLARIANRATIEAQRAAERAAAQDVPEGKHTVSGVVIKLADHEGYGGRTEYKMTVKTDAGFVLWGSVPNSLQLFDYTEPVIVDFADFCRSLRVSEEQFAALPEVGQQALRNLHEEHKADPERRLRQRGLQRGDRVTFTATLTRSERDSKFGFYKRPTKAVVVIPAT